MLLTGEHFLELVKKNKKLSETIIPELIHRLVRETINSGAYTHFPANDDVSTPGFDGVITGNTIEHRFLPLGNLIFEMGAKKDCYKGIAKIDKDYQKRKSDESIIDKNNFTYIAITTSILDAKDKQIKCNEYIKDNIFKSVLIIDAIDITSWLEEHINICIWFLQKYGEKIDDYDVVLVSDEWNRISKATIPNLSNEIFIAGNEGNSKKIILDLKDSQGNKIFTISSDHYGRDFAYAFCVSTIIASDFTDLIERAIVVNSQVGMNYVNAFCKGKIVLVNFNCQDDRFAIELNNTYIFFGILFDVDIELNMIQQKIFEKEVVKLGYSESEASRISFIVDYNVLALRRLMTKIPSIKIPLWSKNHNKYELIPLLLLGEINMDKICDLEFLKSIIWEDVDSYTEKLNLWSEMNQSPILKYENIYRICSRKECFDFLQVDIFSLKLKSLEDKMISALSEINQKYKQENDKWYINDGTYKWRDRLINNVLDGFIILSDKNKRNQLHFDSFVEKIFDKIYGNYELSLTLSHHFKKLCELSPRSYISFLRKSVTSDKDNFEKFMKTTSPGLMMSNNYFNYVLYALENVLRQENCVLTGFETLLDMYYLFPDDKALLEEVIKYLSPFATMTGLLNMPFSKKIDFFFRYIVNKDYDKTFKIVDKLYKNDNNSVMIGVSPSYRNYDGKEIKVTYHEIYDMKSKAFNWLVENEKDSNELIQTLKNLLQNIHSIPFENIRKQLNVVKGKLIDSDDDVKVKANHEILRTRENILKYNNWKYLMNYIPVFDEFLNSIKPSERYIFIKSVLIDDNYPLLDPPTLEDSDWHEKTMKLREQVKKDLLKEIVEKEGKKVIERIIKDCTNNSSMIWNLIYDISEDHVTDFKTILDCKLNIGIRFYLRCMNEKELDFVLKEYENEEFVLQNLPYSKKIYTWVDGKHKEKEYWKHQYFDKTNDSDFEYLFNKFINFAPEKLISTCSYFVELDYDHSIKLLNAISNLIDNESNKEILFDEIYSIQDFVRKMDQKYYTNELSLCEFKLLSVLKSGIEDYPMGIKKYFWDHPDELGKLLIQLHEQKNSLPSGSMGQKILFEAIFSFGGGCYIPSEYIVQRRSDIKKWVNGVLLTSEDKDTETKTLIKYAIINTLATCPKQISDDIWPIKEVADILENLALEDFEDKYEVSSSFSSGYTNRRGIRNVNDGTLEFSLSEEYKKYQIYYQFTHPVTSKALEYISSGYNYEAENDRKRAYLGYE